MKIQVSYYLATILFLSSLFVISCQKEDEDPFADFRRSWPIPTELPDITCEGAHTMGCYVDTVLFVAHFFPNTSSYGSETPEGGIKAYTLPQNNHDIVYVEGQHPLRPSEIDERWMLLDVLYSIPGDSISAINFRYYEYVDLIPDWHGSTRIGDDFARDSPSHSLTWDPDTRRLCGTIDRAELSSIVGTGGRQYEVIDTLIMQDLRLDVIARDGWYP